MPPDPTTIECIYDLLDQVPELQSTYMEHLDDNEELLPHVFMGDVTRYVIQKVRATDKGTASAVDRILVFLEQCMASGSEQVVELVWASFVENLLGHEDVLVYLNGRVGPNLKNALRHYRC